MTDWYNEGKLDCCIGKRSMKGSYIDAHLIYDAPALCEYCIPAIEAGDSMSHLSSPSRQRGTNATTYAFQREAQKRSFLGRFCKKSMVGVPLLLGRAMEHEVKHCFPDLIPCKRAVSKQFENNVITL